MTDYRKFFDKDYIGHWDLKEDGDTVVTITNVEQGELRSPTGGTGSKKDRKPLLSFKGAEKKMVANATNCKTIAALYGPKVEDWIGKRIALYRTTTQVGSETRECIRVRPKAPASKQSVEETADD